MAYGFQLKKVLNNNIIDSLLNYYPTTRSGFSTSDILYFESINFKSTQILITFGNSANLLPVSYSNLPNFNFDLNTNNFFMIARNYSKPTVVKICDISGYETGLGATTYSTSLNLGSQIIKNYNDVNHFYTINNLSPINSIQNSVLSTIINSNYIQGDNFAYVRYSNVNYNKFFLLYYSNSVFSWMEIPTDSFYVNCDFYITNNDVTFNGTKLSYSVFNNIPFTPGQTILINNPINDTLSGLYTITNISNSVNIKNSQLFFNFPGQSFSATTNLDISGLNNNVSVCYYVPYSYGNPGEVFSKPLLLQKYTNLFINSPANYLPILTYENNNLVSQTTFLLQLNNNVNLSKLSDQFQLGMSVSNWCPDSLLMDATLNIEVDGGS
jgi:hypothetical protein